MEKSLREFRDNLRKKLLDVAWGLKKPAIEDVAFEKFADAGIRLILPERPIQVDRWHYGHAAAAAGQPHILGFSHFDSDQSGRSEARRRVNAFRASAGEGPLGSYRASPRPPAARVKAEAYPTRLRKSRRFNSLVSGMVFLSLDDNYSPLVFSTVVKVPLFLRGI